MKNILLPTDLSVQSLRPVHNIVKDAKGGRLFVSVVHIISLPTSISDLLFINQNKPYKQVPAGFTEAFEMLQNKYKDHVESLVFDFVYCNSSRYFNNYIEGNSIQAVFMLAAYNYGQPLPQSENIIPYLNKCKVPLRKVASYPDAVEEYQHLSALLNGNEPLKTAAQVRTAKPIVNY